LPKNNDFALGGFGDDFGFLPKKEKKKKGNNFSVSNDFGFKPLKLDFGFSSPVGKEPQIAPKAKAPQNDFGMIGLGGMFSSNKTIKAPKLPKMPKRKISNTQKLEDKLKQQAAENKIKAKYGIKTPKNSAVAPQAPTLSQRIKQFQNKRYEEGLRKKAGIPKDFEQKIAAEKEKAEVEARTAQAAERYARSNEVYDSNTNKYKSKVFKSNKLDKLKARIKNQRKVRYTFTITKEGDSQNVISGTLSEAERKAGEKRSQGFAVSPIQQIFI
jgi:hypothetical protein